MDNHKKQSRCFLKSQMKKSLSIHLIVERKIHNHEVKIKMEFEIEVGAELFEQNFELSCNVIYF